MPPADGVGLVDERHGVGELGAVDRDGPPGLEAHRHLFGGDLDVVAPGGDAHDRLDDVEAGVEVLELLRLVGRAPDVRVGRVGLLGRVAVGEPAGDEPLAHLFAAAELGDEGGVEPWLVDAQARVGHEAVAVEPLDVVALVGGAVAPDVDAVFFHGAHQEGAGDRATEGRGVEVGLAARADVERAALQGDEALFDERGLRVDGAGDLGAVLLRAIGHRVDVGLVVLADVGGVRAGHGALLAHPRDGDGGVETTGEGDADAFADGQAGEDFRHALQPTCAASCTTTRSEVQRVRPWLASAR